LSEHNNYNVEIDLLPTNFDSFKEKEQTRKINSSNKFESEKEQKAKRDERKYYTAFRLIVGCLIMLGLVYLIDALLMVAFNRNFEQTNNVIEIIKTMLFTLSGYLFGKKSDAD
jgi:hypothetical protein